MAKRKGISTGTTAQRSIEEAGHLRFNTTTDLLEYYNGTIWKPIDSPPTISSVANTNISATQIAANFDLGVNGSGFTSGATVKFIGNDGTEYTSATVTVNSDTLITARVSASVTNANEPFDVKVTNSSGLSATLPDAFNVDAAPVWSTSSGTIATINDDATGTHATVVATDPESDAITYSETTSVLSGAGFTLNSTTGAITGDPTNVSSSTTRTFTLRATSGSNTTDREFSIVVNPAPIVASLLMVAGGGGGGTGGGEGGGGGAGGLVYYGTETPKTPNGGAITLTLGATYTATICAGGTGATVYGANGGNGTSGGNSSFTGSGISLITALGGGTGGTYPSNGAGHGTGVAGGSGGGGGGNSSGGGDQTGGAGTSGQGFAGGNGVYTSSPQAYLGGGGGGASEVGETPPSTKAGDGGDGLAYSITGSSVTYAGGGGAHAAGSGNTGTGNGGAGGGGNNGQNGTNGLGGGGGASSGNGGSGVVILRLPTSQYTGTVTGSPTVTTTGSDTVIKFTSNGTYVA